MKRINILMMVFSLFSLKAFTQSGNTCDSAIAMNVPDTLFPYGANLDSGWVWNGGGGWFKFTAPTGKGIEGFMIDMPISPNCSTFSSVTMGVGVIKGATCATASVVGQNQLFWFYGGGTGNCRYANAPALYDSAFGGDTYYINISNYGFKIRWFTHIVDSFSCGAADTITHIPFTGCNLRNVDFMQPSWIFPGAPFINPVYYTLIPTSNNVSFKVEAKSCLGNGQLYAYLYDDCSFTNLLASSPPIDPLNSFPGNTYQFNISNATPGSPLTLVMDAGRWLGPDIFSPGPSICSFKITDATGILLPVHLLTFTAQLKESNALLNWHVEAEQNFDRYQIERSPNAKDFTGIGAVKAANKKEYSYTDNVSSELAVVSNQNSQLPTHNSLYYRLKLIDRDGSFTYSPIRSINIKHSTLNIYPNPAHNVVTITGEHLKTITLADNTGRTVLTKVPENENLIELVVGHLPKGIYLLTVTTTGGNTQSEMLIVE